ncbi:MAG: M3 family metallopeptidase [Neisseriaceae bacterium]
MLSDTLLRLGLVPAFPQIESSEIEKSLNDLLAQVRQEISAVKKTSPLTWVDSVDPLTTALERIGRAWGVVAHLHSVKNTPELRKVYNQMIPIISEFYTEVAQDLELYERLKRIEAECEESLSFEQKQKLHNDLRTFRLAGAHLSESSRKKLAQLHSELSVLHSKFSQNVLDSTDSFSWYIENQQTLRGIPPSDLALFEAGAKSKQRAGYEIKLQQPYYISIMKFAEERQVREIMYRAYTTRASELFQKGQWDNGEVIDAILEKSTQQARLLQYNSYADLSLVTKMANTPSEVLEFLKEMVTKALPVAKLEMQELANFAQEQLGLETLQPWDMSFVSEKLRESRYAFSEEIVKQYFEVGKVFEGLFHLINELYGVEFEFEARPVWHKDVQYFRLVKNNQELGGVYIDLYAREGKKGGAWMNEYCGRWKKKEGLQLPIAYLICNFTPVMGEQKSYLTHQEIITLFHEMGHCLHHLLTTVDELDVAGISGVEWDAVELPSQLMENFAWEFDVLESMSQHRVTGEKIPHSLFEQMKKAKNFQAGLFLLRQMEFSLFDMTIYSQGELQTPVDWRSILEAIRAEVSVTPQWKENRFAHSFEHIFAGGYSAGYYSYIWAELLSADVYEAFLEADNRHEVGQRFWKEILSKGGARPMLDSFIAFRGRKPKVDALLRHLGLIN